MNRIQEIRKKNGMTQVQLAKLLGIPQSTMSTYETGRHEPDNEMLKNLADLLAQALIRYWAAPLLKAQGGQFLFSAQCLPGFRSKPLRMW